jgi:prephenate dehydrogenase
VTIAGVGLIGGSLALAARQRGLIAEAIGFGRNEANLRTARERGIVDGYSLDARQAADGADLLFLAVPVGAMGDVAAACAPVLRSDAIVTDAGSVKAAVVAAVEAALPAGMTFVGAHPVAGGEQAGAASARADLFEDHCIITPGGKSSAASIGKIRDLWEGVGMRVVEMDVGAHDALMGRVSHLPHVLAFALVDAFRDRYGDLADLSGPSFRDLTRIAAGPAEVWSDIFVANRSELVAALDEFSGAFEELRGAIKRGDHAALRRLIERARQARARIVR